jgi:hypothetical protein
MRLFKLIAPLLLTGFASLFLIAAPAQAKDGFEEVQCGGDVAHAMIGKRTTNEAVVKIEARHTGLGLKDLGGDEVSDNLDSVSWLVCGKEYMVVEDKSGLVRDVLVVPPHSRAFPETDSATCQVKGKAQTVVVVAILDNQADAKANPTASYGPNDMTPLAATAAWKINVKTGKFSPFPAAGLTCPRSAIITADGGA